MNPCSDSSATCLSVAQLLVQSTRQASRARQSANQPFCTPTLHQFTDRQELLLVDRPPLMKYKQ